MTSLYTISAPGLYGHLEPPPLCWLVPLKFCPCPTRPQSCTFFSYTLKKSPRCQLKVRGYCTVLWGLKYTGFSGSYNGVCVRVVLLLLKTLLRKSWLSNTTVSHSASISPSHSSVTCFLWKLKKCVIDTLRKTHTTPVKTHNHTLTKTHTDVHTSTHTHTHEHTHEHAHAQSCTRAHTFMKGNILYIL